ncbi:hypothetical protein MSG28_000524 [Choristoneura fumiferana]|uniref:Uncharacterized protein n=1 Tax=Choristoneura fumiferana TaxID=7141 RepID=A0ACC0K103_CHOFU|nr:hypothetical protein MSG28_000524 [Choristoneura fumiferana]
MLVYYSNSDTKIVKVMSFYKISDKLRLLLLATLFLIQVTEGSKAEFVTCGTILKIMNVDLRLRLHSHDVKYGSGSGQQSVTAVDVTDDTNSHWLVRAPMGETCKRGEPIKCNTNIRLQHLSTKKNLHSHYFSSPLSGNQEVSCYGDDGGEGDSGDHWTVVCNNDYWRRDTPIKLRHVDTAVFLAGSGRTFGRPISGQGEIVVSRVLQLIASAALDMQSSAAGQAGIAKVAEQFLVTAVLLDGAESECPEVFLHVDSPVGEVHDDREGGPEPLVQMRQARQPVALAHRHRSSCRRNIHIGGRRRSANFSSWSVRGAVVRQEGGSAAGMMPDVKNWCCSSLVTEGRSPSQPTLGGASENHLRRRLSVLSTTSAPAPRAAQPRHAPHPPAHAANTARLVDPLEKGQYIIHRPMRIAHLDARERLFIFFRWQYGMTVVPEGGLVYCLAEVKNMVDEFATSHTVPDSVDCFGLGSLTKQLSWLFNMRPDSSDAVLPGQQFGLEWVDFKPNRRTIMIVHGLDPAQPCFRTSDISERLDKSDADFVDVIHTNGRLLKKIGFGLPEPTGHADFYPNGGMQQPGCHDNGTKSLWSSFVPFPSQLQQAICSHGRAYLLFTESLINNNCSFRAYRWNLSYEGVNDSLKASCDRIGSCSEMGIKACGGGAMPGALGPYFVLTTEKVPYCLWSVGGRWLWVCVLVASGAGLALMLRGPAHGQLSYTPDTRYLHWTTTYPAVTVCETLVPSATQKKITRIRPTLMQPLNYNYQRHLTKLMLGQGACTKELCVPCGPTVACDVPWRQIVEEFQFDIKIREKNRVELLFSIVEIQNDPLLKFEDINVRGCRYLNEVPRIPLHDYPCPLEALWDYSSELHY